ncbi:hypothetical protein LUZ63_018015 [Rhynchospora breviuscula]|uniref:Uncharacterized protein n=1 Tax=Rhynchospora breviuscula TaxID=2022672 RepID=A0A9Q0HI16_9POAL|nr:hypothetical protein LUZ63_018015 [Rhynchospora breviuscula]
MAKLTLLALMALCTFASVALVNAIEFNVEGRVYCDTCRAGFETNVTEPIGAGAKVRIECKKFGTDPILYSVDGITDNTGKYRIVAQGNHDEQICDVVLVESPRPDCKEINKESYRARVSLFQDSGISTNDRYANALGFVKDKPLDVCGAIMKMYESEEEY